VRVLPSGLILHDDDRHFLCPRHIFHGQRHFLPGLCLRNVSSFHRAIVVHGMRCGKNTRIIRS
jgi:hypothetical protein